MWAFYVISAFITRILSYLIVKYDNESKGTLNTNISSFGGKMLYL